MDNNSNNFKTYAYSDFIKLENTIKYSFKSKQLLTQALTHKSHKYKPNNERLEFLGDSVVSVVVSEYIYHNFKHYQEGNLSKLRASLVNEQSLNKIANHINLGDYIVLSVAEQKNDGRKKSSIVSDAFEALIGAIFIEAGIEKAKAIILEIMDKVFTNIDLDNLYKDYKTLLQEYTQSKYSTTPKYLITEENGPEHNKIFTVCACVDRRHIATSQGKSRKSAEQNCAKKALELLEKNSNLDNFEKRDLQL